MLASSRRTSLSAIGTKPAGIQPRKIEDFKALSHATRLNKIPTPKSLLCKVEPLQIQVEDAQDGFVTGFLHLPVNFARNRTTAPKQTAAIFLSGAGGGVVGPSSVYLGISDKLASLERGIPCLRLDYRFPARNSYCARDVTAAMDLMKDLYGLERFILVGWSFGGAPALTVAGKDQRVVGCATIASQTAETDGIRQLSPRPLLLLHGTADRTLGPSCSGRLYTMYGPGGQRTLKLFDGDDHALTQNAGQVENMLCDFITSCADLKVDDSEKELLQTNLIEDGERLEKMQSAGDLSGGENLR
ncbi:alpha/beta-hydrolase [Eremomyces bilateralis CBS 781.70]|uniref:Alpha/beta-hydrolase n=1 Tax=Eremomyces bilateralis CBS 781.70 TaxID=1392243 RepID=A0A6G1FRK6_9PEZI|nr:alpha/beta-hydrolase [Eremomyces bilateralis CBS 781.70]KAF1808350.1 alpha/beta-hydrolase [Eremomyces bilateralis CBS 781.70]